mgnify:FL=1|tara:strand:+ start:75 stop:1127 length:1053 start_codon:yes stop_codon:yes gene_type:complete
MSNTDKKDIKEQISEAIENGLNTYKEATEAAATVEPTAFEDPALYADTDGKGAMINKPVAAGAEGNMATITAKPSDAVASEKPKKKKEEEMSEEAEEVAEETSIEDYLASLFSEDELSEDFKEKLTTIFSTALAERVNHIQAALQETFNQNLNDQVETISEELSEKLDEFLSYVVEEWTKENTLAIERGIKADIAESFMTGLKDLFETHYIDMPDEKVQVMEELLDSKNELEEQLNQQLEKNIELQKDIHASAATNIFIESSNGLTDTEIEKFAHLAETIEYDSVDEYARKLRIIKESFMGSVEPESDEVTLTENKMQDLNETAHQTIDVDPTIAAYSKVIGFQNRNRDK